MTVITEYVIVSKIIVMLPLYVKNSLYLYTCITHARIIICLLAVVTWCCKRNMETILSIKSYSYSIS